MKREPFIYPVRVLYGDTDAGSVVYHANYLRYFEAGRTEFMRERVLPYRRIEEMGIIMPVTESFLRYKAPAFYDDLIFVETTLAELSRYKCKFSYRVWRKDGEKERLLVRGYTVLAPITTTGKLTRIPQELLKNMMPWAENCEQQEQA